MASVTKELDASNLDPALKSHVQKFLGTSDAARFDLKNLVKCISRNFVAKGLGHLPMVDGGCKVDHMKTEPLGYRINVLSKNEIMKTATSLKVKIEDEHDYAVEGVRRQPDGSVNVDGSVTIRDLNRALDWELPDDDWVTVAGLVIHEAQTIPEPGQTFIFHGHRFQVLRRQRNQITALRVSPPLAEAAAGSTG